MPANAVLNYKDTKTVMTRTLYETGDDTEQVKKHCTIFRVAKRIVLETLFVISVMVTTKAQGRLHLEPGYELTTRRCMPVKGIAEGLLNRPVYAVVTNTLTRLWKVKKPWVLGRLNDDIYNIINMDSQTSKGESPSMNVISIVVNEQSTSMQRTYQKKSNNWPKFIPLTRWKRKLRWRIFENARTTREYVR